MQSDSLTAWIEIDLGALIQNARTLREHAAVPLIPMVKADAYGLGAERVVQALSSLDPWALGVATVEEGASLRAAGVRLPIIVFNPPLPGELESLRRSALRPALGTAKSIQAWTSSSDAPWHLSIDTGMNRAGMRWDSVHAHSALLASAPPEGAFTHFHSAEMPDGSMEQQEDRFRSALDRLPSRPKVLHAENSAAIVRRARSRWDLARPGIFLYGVGSGAEAAVYPREVVSLHARIVETRELREGDTVSYGGTYRAPAARRIATAALGYADGYRRSFSNSGMALINGKRVPIAGVVTMDMTMLDVTGVRCETGDVATFYGRAALGGISLEEAARTAALSPYELLTGLRSRLPRVYVE